MTKKMKHLPPNLLKPSMLDMVNYKTINEQKLFFTPLSYEKEPLTENWPNQGMNYWDALTLVSQDDNNYTGIGLIHGLSKSAAFDIDDLAKTEAYFRDRFKDNGERLFWITASALDHPKITVPRPSLC